MTDDWGCHVDLFAAKSLTELVDSLTKKNLTPKTVETENAKSPIATKTTQGTSGTKIGMVHAPKILKKKKTNGHRGNSDSLKILNDPANPKRVHFDIEQFLSREAGKGDREEARQRMLTSLGAAPAKRDYKNYKELKVERATKKAEAKAHQEMHHANNIQALTKIKKKKTGKK